MAYAGHLLHGCLMDSIVCLGRVIFWSADWPLSEDKVLSRPVPLETMLLAFPRSIFRTAAELAQPAFSRAPVFQTRSSCTIQQLFSMREGTVFVFAIIVPARPLYSSALLLPCLAAFVVCVCSEIAVQFDFASLFRHWSGPQ